LADPKRGAFCMPGVPESYHVILIVLKGYIALEQRWGIAAGRRSANDDLLRSITLMSQWKQARRRHRPLE
jgi:hypothetical protein